MSYWLKPFNAFKSFKPSHGIQSLNVLHFLNGVKEVYLWG